MNFFISSYSVGGNEGTHQVKWKRKEEKEDKKKIQSSEEGMVEARSISNEYSKFYNDEIL